MRKDINSASWK